MPLNNVPEEHEPGFDLSAFAQLLEPHEFEAMKDEIRQLVREGAQGDELDRYADSKGWPQDAARQAVMELVLEGELQGTPGGVEPTEDEMFVPLAKRAQDAPFTQSFEYYTMGVAEAVRGGKTSVEEIKQHILDRSGMEIDEAKVDSAIEQHRAMGGEIGQQITGATKIAEDFVSWFERFLGEKNLPFVSWDIPGEDGTPHMIDSDVVIEAIKGASSNEQAQIKDMIVKLDFGNADINDYFKHLAKALVLGYGLAF